jgi:5-methylcytosine-specific restriction enzyme A
MDSDGQGAATDEGMGATGPAAGTVAVQEDRLMAQGPARWCSRCRGIHAYGERCPAAAEQRREIDKRRGNFRERGYSSRWDKAADAFRTENPLCAECEREGHYVPAYCVDHIVPHRGDMDLFWDVSNWQSLCRRHHASKTARGL